MVNLERVGEIESSSIRGLVTMSTVLPPWQGIIHSCPADLLPAGDAPASPAAASERIAVSRPEPGPLTNTSTFVMPCSWARRAACSAASCAAKGVLLREPLKPTLPALAHDRVFPSRSVIVTIVLLKVDLMCAWPWEMLRFSFRRGFFAFGFAMAYLPFFRFTPTVFFGPFRVRAFVWVRWP